MTTDLLRDLREWNRLTEPFEDLQDSGDQYGLSRLLRSRFNWRLRRKAVQNLSTLSNPNDRIARLVLEIVSDEHTEFDRRTVAADFLCGLISTRQQRGRWTSDLKKDIIREAACGDEPAPSCRVPARGGAVN